MGLTRQQSSRHDVTILAVYLLLAITLTYPLVTHLSTYNLGEGVDDPTLTWSLWWTRFAIFDLGTSPLQTDYVFYPLGINLVAYTPTFLNGVLSIPLQFAFGTIAAQNLLVFFALVAGGYGTSLLAREILARLGIERTHQTDIATAIAGAFYAFGAWHFHYVAGANFFLLHNEWIPFYTLYLLRMDKQAWGNGARAGLFLVLSAWTELTFAMLLSILTGLYWLYLVTANRSVLNRRFFSNVMALAMITAIGVSPLAINLLDDTLRYGYYLAQGVGRIQIFSAEPISFFVPSYHHPLLGEWADNLTNANTKYAFIGYAALILAGLGFFFRRASRDVRFWAVLAFFFALVMLGPALVIGGENTGIPMPFAILREIPFVNANRYPVRFNVLMMLSLTPLIALGTRHLMRTRRGTLLLTGLVLLLAFEQLVYPLPTNDLSVPAVYRTFRDEPGDFAILELPLGWRGSIPLQGKLDDKVQFYQTVHRKRLLAGITSRTPRFKFQYFLEAPVINSLIALETEREIDEARVAQDRAVAPRVLRFFDIRYVVVNRALTAPTLLQYALDIFPMQEIYRDEARILYRVAALPMPDQVDLTDETACLNFDDGWGRVQFTLDGVAYRWATRGDSLVWLPLARTDQAITFRLRGARTGQKVSIRVNGQVVSEVTMADTWEDYTAHIPASVVRDGLNEFTFVTETSPLDETRQGDYTVFEGGTVSPVDISATGAGFDAGKFGEIFVAGRNVIANKRGYHLVVIDPRYGTVENIGSFDTFADAAESVRLAQFVEQIPGGKIVAGVAVDDVSQNLQPIAVHALGQLGVGSDLRYQFRAGHAFIGVKGIQPGQALERVDGHLPANVSVGRNVASDRVAFALGGIIVTSGE